MIELPVSCEKYFTSLNAVDVEIVGFEYSSLALFKRSLKAFLFRQTFKPSSSCIARL